MSTALQIDKREVPTLEVRIGPHFAWSFKTVKLVYSFLKTLYVFIYQYIYTI